MSAEQPRNSFRAAVLRGEQPPLVVTDKAPRRGRSDDVIDGKIVARSEQRRSNHRGKDRHRLASEKATVRHRGRKHKVELVNLSAGGAMIRCKFAPKLWDMLELEIADGPRFEGAVRWIVLSRPESRNEILTEVMFELPTFGDVAERSDDLDRPARGRGAHGGDPDATLYRELEPHLGWLNAQANIRHMDQVKAEMKEAWHKYGGAMPNPETPDDDLGLLLEHRQYDRVADKFGDALNNPDEIKALVKAADDAVLANARYLVIPDREKAWWSNEQQKQLWHRKAAAHNVLKEIYENPQKYLKRGN